MKKSCRLLLSVFLVVMLSITSVVVTKPAHAETMTGSEEIIDLIKVYEGFRSQVYWVGGIAYIGYGTSCSSSSYPNGISADKADALLRETLAAKEKSINAVLTKYSVQLKQNQFDALLSFTYNIGTGWMSSNNRIYVYLTTGFENYSDIEIVNAFGTWCHQGKNVLDQLVERRLKEAKIFLYNDYAGTDAHAYKYITYDAGDGIVDHSIEFYESGSQYGTLQPAQRAGYTLSGWYTEGGVKLNTWTVAAQNVAVSAVWVEGTQVIENGIYADVLTTDWFYPYVSELSSYSIISGYPDGSFRPAKSITRGEALKLILLAVGFNEQAAISSHWASGYLTLAASKGVADAGALSDLNVPITRREVAELAAKSIGLPALESEATFADTTDGFVLALYHCNIVLGNTDSGVRNYFPNDNITRAEMSTIIWRIVNSNLIPE